MIEGSSSGTLAFILLFLKIHLIGIDMAHVKKSKEFKWWEGNQKNGR